MTKQTKPKLKLRLPDLPSEALLMAVRDLEAVERMKSVTVNMGQWLTRRNGTKRKGSVAPCEVCFAGAVMRRGLPKAALDSRLSSDNAEIRPELFNAKTERKLDGLDEFRRGHVLRALSRFDIDEADARGKLSWLMSNRWEGMELDVADYDEDPALFKTQMRMLAVVLREAGL
jgi:hypothetical protein